jgi:hypothetical protein
MEGARLRDAEQERDLGDGDPPLGEITDRELTPERVHEASIARPVAP